MLKLLNAQIAQCSNCSMLDLLNARFAQCSNCSMLKLLNAQIAQCSICSMLDLLNVRFAQCSKPPKKCSKSPVPCKNSKFKNSKLRQSRNNSKFKNQQSKIIPSPSPPRHCFCRTVRYVRASAYTWRQQTCPPLLCSRPVSGSRGSRPSRCRRSL